MDGGVADTAHANTETRMNTVVRYANKWTFQCQIQKRHPLRGETSTDETTPNPTDLGRISDETARLHMDQYVSRTLECQVRLPVSDLRFGVTVRDGLRKGSSVSLVCGIT